jgi:hypothetical protein
MRYGSIHSRQEQETFRRHRFPPSGPAPGPHRCVASPRDTVSMKTAASPSMSFEPAHPPVARRLTRHIRHRRRPSSPCPELSRAQSRVAPAERSGSACPHHRPMEMGARRRRNARPTSTHAGRLARKLPHTASPHLGLTLVLLWSIEREGDR